MLFCQGSKLLGGYLEPDSAKHAFQSGLDHEGVTAVSEAVGSKQDGKGLVYTQKV